VRTLDLWMMARGRWVQAQSDTCGVRPFLRVFLEALLNDLHTSQVCSAPALKLVNTLLRSGLLLIETRTLSHSSCNSLRTRSLKNLAMFLFCRSFIETPNEYMSVPGA